MNLDRRLFSCLAASAVFAPGLARAQAGGAPTVVELFTSQGCSSCPPADALMVELAKEQGMIPLTFPVTIWDYLGWRDTLAQAEFTRRQKAYASSVAGKRVYTPQAIVNGGASCVGSDFSAIVKLKGTTRPAGETRVRIETSNDGWLISAQIAVSADKAHLLILPLSSRETVPIGRGENSGRTITYANVVRAIRDLGEVRPGYRQVPVRRADMAEEQADGFAVLIQSGGSDAPGAILAAAMVSPDGVKA